MAAELTNLVHSFAGRRLLLIGDLILDRYIYGDAERISPEAPVPVLRVVETRNAVGGSANVASCLRALGCEVTICGVVGDDRHGEMLRGLLRELNVDTQGILTTADRPTTTKTRLVGLAQHRHRQQLLRVDREDASPLSSTETEQIITSLCSAIPQIDAVCIEDYDKGVVSSVLVKAVVSQARRHGKPVLVDPARLEDFARYRGATVLTPNREELGHAVGMIRAAPVRKRVPAAIEQTGANRLPNGRGSVWHPLDTVESVAEAAGLLVEQLDLQAVVATVDRDGAVVVERGVDWRHVPTRPRSVYDNTGAGDAVLAMLAAAVAAGADFVSATKLANIAGGLEVEKFGCVPIQAQEVLAELRLEERRRNGKVRTVDELAAEVTLRRDRGETVAFTNGCFDILHAGHVDFLQRCRELASMLVIGLNSDASIREQGKGDGPGTRPINRLEHRSAVLSALECVDYIVVFDEPTPEGLIRAVKPDVLVKGRDWADRGVVGAEFVEASGGRVVLLPLVEGLSTTSLIERVRGGNG